MQLSTNHIIVSDLDTPMKDLLVWLVSPPKYGFIENTNRGEILSCMCAIRCEAAVAADSSGQTSGSVTNKNTNTQNTRCMSETYCYLCVRARGHACITPKIISTLLLMSHSIRTQCSLYSLQCHCHLSQLDYVVDWQCQIVDYRWGHC